MWYECVYIHTWFLHLSVLKLLTHFLLQDSKFLYICNLETAHDDLFSIFIFLLHLKVKSSENLEMGVSLWSIFHMPEIHLLMTDLLKWLHGYRPQTPKVKNKNRFFEWRN